MDMQRLIDANALINALNVFSDVVHGNKHFLTGIESAKELVVGLPTIDAVPVVRCHECAHCGFCGNETSLEIMGFFGYCSRGVRRITP